jgi:ATP-binding cassette subfamily F protein 2
MESIDALAKALNEFKGGMVLVSHDMRLIGQVAKEIWICDDKTITKHTGGIQSFKMDMRAQMGIDGTEAGSAGKSLKGDASVKKKKESAEPPPAPKKPEPKLEVIAPPAPAVVELPPAVAPPAAPPAAAVAPPAPPSKVPEDDATATKVASTPTTNTAKASYVPLHLRGKSGDDSGASASTTERPRYVPPHLRK